MATSLNFTQNAQDHWEATFSASGDRMGVEVNRTASGPLVVYGSIDGLNKNLIQDFGPDAFQDLLFEIDLPSDIEITIVSFSEVIAAKVTGV